MACMRTLSYGMHVEKCMIMHFCSQLSTALYLYDPLGQLYSTVIHCLCL